MKLTIILGFIVSTMAWADFVYMREDGLSKSIIHQVHELGTYKVINEAQSKNWAIYPDLSADGQEIVYAEGPGQNDLHLTYHHLGKKIVQRFLPTQKGMVLHPKFSKNSQYIFYSAPGPNGKNTIHFFDRANEVSRQGEALTHFSLEKAEILDASEESYFPRPSSDGNFIIYQRNKNGKKEIVLFDRLENKKKIIAEGMSPALSFDERWIAYTSKKEGNWNIYVTERTTGVTIQATHDEHDEMAPTFMPDNTIAFSSNKTGNYQLYKIDHGKWVKITQNETESKVDLYSPQFSGTTTIKQSLKPSFIGNPRSSFGTVQHQSKIYMAGGHQGAEHTYPPESFSDSFIVYDTQTHTWHELAPRPAKSHGYQLAAYGNYIYAFGGFAYSENHRPRWKSLDQIDRYDISQNKWETIGKLFLPRSSNVAVTINDKVYLVAGWNATPKFVNDYDGHFHQTIEIFDLKSEKVEKANFNIPSPVRRALTGIEQDGKILLIGGLGQGASHFELLNNVTSIDPNTGSSQELRPLAFATFAPAAEILNNKLYVFGGMFKTGEMSYEYVSHIYAFSFFNSKWSHTGRYLRETKGFSQVFKFDESTLGILGGHHYYQGHDAPVSTFETFGSSK